MTKFYLKLAFDESARQIDADGRLHVLKSHISKATVNPYYGKEIPNWESLGLDPEKVYQLLRDPVELQKAAETFARLPILSKHIPVTVDEPQPDLVIGAIGSDVKFNAPYLDADLSFWDKSAIAAIETETIKELSCAYRYDAVMQPGEYEGVAFDGIMTNMRGNHLALVEVGRAGPDVVVADQNPFIEDKTVKMTKLGKALFVSIGAVSPVLAQDSSFGGLVANATKKIDKSKLKNDLIAKDANLSPEQFDNIIDALIGVEDQPAADDINNPNPEVPMAAGDESPAEKIKSLLAGKVDDSVINQIIDLIAPESAQDDSSDKIDAAMDSMRADMIEAQKAAREVRAVVGDVDLYKPDEIYAFALDHMNVDHKGISDVNSLRALFRVASKNKSEAPVVAADSSGVYDRFPNLKRFG